MGEYAEMALDGTVCESCGVFIDDGGGQGFPRYCSKQCARDRGVGDVTSTRAERHADRATPPQLHMRKRDVAWLKAAAAENADGLYAGALWDRCPTAFRRLVALGFVNVERPRNPVHKDRAVITPTGRAALAEAEAKFERLATSS